MKTKQPACPECEKLSAVSQKSNELGEFLDWLEISCGYKLCLFDDKEGRYYPDFLPTEKLLAMYFDIDLDTVDKERFALLEWLRSQNDN